MNMTYLIQTISDSSQSPNNSEIPKLITFLSCLLQRVSESNDQNAPRVDEEQDTSSNVSIFHGLTRPNISIQTYLDRIFKYANCSPSCFVVAYIYLDRFSQRQPFMTINSLNVHRLLITSVMVAAKFMDDMYYNNAYYAKIGGISLKEMNYLEVDFLFGLGFNLNVTPNTFQAYCCHLQGEMMILQRQSPRHHFEDISNNIQLCFEDDETTHQNAQQRILV